MDDIRANELAVEAIVKERFGLQLAIKQLVADSIPVSHTAEATVFLTPKHQLFAFVRARSNLTLGDVEKMAKKMGLVVAEFVPPHHDQEYFNDEGRKRFKDVFPGRHHIDETELRYYRKLAPYNPALLRVDAVKDGVIRQFDSHDSSEWRVAARFAYKQITAL